MPCQVHSIITKRDFDFSSLTSSIIEVPLVRAVDVTDASEITLQVRVHSRTITAGSIQVIAGAVNKFQAGILAAGRVPGGLWSTDEGRMANMERGPGLLQSSSTGTCCTMGVPGSELLGRLGRASDMQR